MAPQSPETSRSVDRAFRCEYKGCIVSFMLCPLCGKYPCKQLSAQDIRDLMTSPLMEREVIRLKPRKIKMFIIKYLDGSLKEAPELDPNQPDPELMQNAETVYQVGKELVPVIVLKPKPKDKKETKNTEKRTKKS